MYSLCAVFVAIAGASGSSLKDAATQSDDSNLQQQQRNLAAKWTLGLTGDNFELEDEEGLVVLSIEQNAVPITSTEQGIGIGTTSPAATLHLVGEQSFTTDGNANILGDANVLGDLIVDKSMTTNGELTAQAVSTPIIDTVAANVLGDITVEGMMTSGHAIIQDSLEVSGSVEIGGAATVTGDFTTQSSAVIGSGLSVVGSTTIGDQLDVSGPLVVAGSATVTGSISGESASLGMLDVGEGGVSIQGTTTMNGPLSVQSETSLTDVEVLGGASVTGEATFSSDVTVDGTATIANLVVRNDILFNGDRRLSSLNEVEKIEDLTRKVESFDALMMRFQEKLKIMEKQLDEVRGKKTDQ